MKRFSTILLGTVLAIFLVAGTSNATLLGMKNYAGGTPDVWYDAGGTANYVAATDLFYVIAWDKVLYLEKPGSGIDLGLKVGFGLAIQVDQNGDLVGGVSGHSYTWDGVTVTSDYDMVEYVLADFSFEYGGQTYSFKAGDMFLAGEIEAFGWQDNATGLDEFDFLFDNITGKLVDYGLWPTDAYLTGSYLDTVAWKVGGEDWDAWEEDLIALTEKGDKFPVPVPEPATMLLLGGGLVGLASFGRKKLFKG